MAYNARKLKVKDMRDIWKHEYDDNELPFQMALRCITNNGNPISENELDELDINEFERLMEIVNPKKKDANPV